MDKYFTVTGDLRNYWGRLQKFLGHTLKIAVKLNKIFNELKISQIFKFKS